jgi:hypothetical protein
MRKVTRHRQWPHDTHENHHPETWDRYRRDLPVERECMKKKFWDKFHRNVKGILIWSVIFWVILKLPVLSLIDWVLRQNRYIVLPLLAIIIIILVTIYDIFHEE